VNSARVGLNNKCGNMNGATLKIVSYCLWSDYCSLSIILRISY